MQKLVEAPTLAYADFSKPFELHTDASGRGLGSVLYQKQDGKLRVIAYASRGLKPSEVNYPAHKLEFLALKWAVTEKFTDYLYGNKFIVKTDNNPLTYVLTSAKLDAAGHRWLANLSMYDFSIEYRAGSQNIDADILSRRPRRDETEENDGEANTLQFDTTAAICKGSLCAVIMAETLGVSPEALDILENQTPTVDAVDTRKLQREDQQIKRVIQYLNRGRQPSPRELKEEAWGVKKLLGEWHNLELVAGVLYRKTTGSRGPIRQLVLPRQCRDEAFHSLHNDVGHPGRERTLELMQKRFYYPGMTSEIADRVANCRRCICRKAGSRNKVAPLVKITTTAPLELVCIDYLSLPKSRGYEYVLVITDHFTKLALAVPTRNMTAKTTARVLYDNFIVHYGTPARIHSDQGRSFEGKIIKELCDVLGVRKSRTTPYHPMSNGATERLNRTMIGLLGTLSEDRKAKWKDYLPSLVHAYNCMRHETTGMAPYELMFGRVPNLPIDLKYGLNPEAHEKSYTEYITELKSRLDYAFKMARQASEQAAKKQKENYDKKAGGPVLQIGDEVFVRKVGIHEHDKLADKWESSVYVVVEQPNPEIPVYVVKSDDSGKKRTLHRNLLLPLGRNRTTHTTGEVETVGQVDSDSDDDSTYVEVEEQQPSTEMSAPSSLQDQSPVPVDTDQQSTESEVPPGGELLQAGGEESEDMESSQAKEQSSQDTESSQVEEQSSQDTESSQDTASSQDEEQSSQVKENASEESSEARDIDLEEDKSADSPVEENPQAQEESLQKAESLEEKGPAKRPVPAPRRSTRQKRPPQWFSNSSDWVHAQTVEEESWKPEWANKVDYFLSVIATHPAISSRPEVLQQLAVILR